MDLAVENAKKMEQGAADTLRGEVPADFRFDPAKLEIPFFRIPIEDGEEPVAIARHSDISYDGKGPKLKDGDFEPVDGDYVQTVRTSFTLADWKAFTSTFGRRGKVCKTDYKHIEPSCGDDNA